MFQNIPQEMRSYRQFICWRSEVINEKPTKVPYCPQTGRRASVSDPSTWCSFEQAVEASKWYSGIGFVFTEHDPFFGIDLDDPKGDEKMQAVQYRIYEQFDTYAELSPSGRGLHLIGKAHITSGKHPHGIGIFSALRFFTMTGNVYRNVPIKECQALAETLWQQMGANAEAIIQFAGTAQSMSDDEIIDIAARAENGIKFENLYKGDWQHLYPSQSEADFALIDIIAYYTQNREQVTRIFRSSNLGNRAKASRNQYINEMVNRSFDRMVPMVNIEAARENIDAQLRKEVMPHSEPERFQSTPGSFPLQAPASFDLGPTPYQGAQFESNQPQAEMPTISLQQPAHAFEPAAATQGSDTSQTRTGDPSAEANQGVGLLGEITEFYFKAAPRPVAEIALAGAIATLAGIVSRSYNVSGTGLNQYILMVAGTGTGKEAMASGRSKLFAACRNTTPSIDEFIGPAEIASGPALLKQLSKQACFCSIVGEFGLRLKELCNPRANSAQTTLRRTILDLYSKSGKSDVLLPSVYSDRDKNIAAIKAPNLTILGESTPERLYENFDDGLVTEGLLPRFLTIEYTGKRVDYNEAHVNEQPSPSLVNRVTEIAAYCLSLQQQNKVIDVRLDEQATEIFRDYNRYCDSRINSATSDMFKELWTRAWLKAAKLAALAAVGCDPYHPTINAHNTRWAMEIVSYDITALTARFVKGDVGGANTDNACVRHVAKMIREYIEKPYSEIKAYDTLNSGELLHAHHVVPFSYIQRRCAAVSCFKNSRAGSTNAIRNAISTLNQMGITGRVDRKRSNDYYKTSAELVAIIDFHSLSVT